MALGFYMDEHIPRPITAGLRARGVDVLTVQEDGRRAEADPAILNRSTELGCVLFAFDADLLREATRRQRTGGQFSGQVFAHLPRISAGTCIRDLEFIVKVGVLGGPGRPDHLLAAPGHCRRLDSARCSSSPGNSCL